MVKIGDVIISKTGYSSTVIDIFKKGNKKRAKLLFEYGDYYEGCYYEISKGNFTNTSISKKHSRLYTIYKRYDCMKQRCENKNSISFKNYGKRGICQNFKDFFDYYSYIKTLDNYEELLKHPSLYEIDRIDNDGDYEIGNLRIITISENQRNRSDNVLYNLIDMNTNVVIFSGIATDVKNKIYEITKCKTGISSKGILKWNIGLKHGFRLKVEYFDKEKQEEQEGKISEYLKGQTKFRCYIVKENEKLIFGRARTINNKILSCKNKSITITDKKGRLRTKDELYKLYGVSIDVEYVGEFYQKEINDIKMGE